MFLMVMFCGTAFADMKLPSNKALVKPGGVSWEEVTITVDKTNGTATVFVSTFGQNGTVFTLYRAFASVNGNKWLLITDGNNKLVTKTTEDKAIADLALPGKGIYRVRLWAYSDKDWFLINKVSKFYRTDAKSDPAYEFIVSTETGEVMPVPKDYPAWE
jgi:hypothetical protein